MRLINADTGEVYCSSHGTYGTGARGGLAHILEALTGRWHQRWLSVGSCWPLLVLGTQLLPCAHRRFVPQTRWRCGMLECRQLK